MATKKNTNEDSGYPENSANGDKEWEDLKREAADKRARFYALLKDEEKAKLAKACEVVTFAKRPERIYTAEQLAKIAAACKELDEDEDSDVDQE